MSFCCDVNLISFGTEDQTSAIRKALVALGSSVKTVSRQQWLNDYVAEFNPSVLILGNDHSFEKVMQGNKTCFATSSLLVFYSYPISKFVQTFLSSSQECCGWPCENHELALRLERLSLITNSSKALYSDELADHTWSNLNLLGSSASFKKTLNIIKKSADCEAPVLIEGETGSGKEMVARAVHYLSERRDYPFIPVNCGAIPDLLVENELFGHEKGAYTDAKQSQKGLITQADQGTLFLDEIETLSAKGQIVLLRFIEDQNIKPLGSINSKKVNVRIVAASNMSLSELVGSGQFRQDLLFRLNLLLIQLPPLRERISDIECLADYFMEKFRKQYQQPDKQLSSELKSWLNQYDWPGNVRELENYIHRQFLLSDKTLITVDSDQSQSKASNSRRKNYERRLNFDFDSSFQSAKMEMIQQFENRYLHWLLKKSNGNVSKAACLSKKERSALGKLLKKNNIDPSQYRSS